MEKAERIKAERKAKEQAAMANPAWDDGGVLPESRAPSRVTRSARRSTRQATPWDPPWPPRAAAARRRRAVGLDMLHAMGDKKLDRR